MCRPHAADGARLGRRTASATDVLDLSLCRSSPPFFFRVLVLVIFQRRLRSFVKHQPQSTTEARANKNNTKP